MKIWLRLHGYEPCSWTEVWQNLRKAFVRAGDEVCDIEEPTDPEDYVELWWGDPQFWRWSKLPVRARVALALSEAHSILASGRNEVIRNLNRAELIICPSASATTAFKEAPIAAPIKVVPFGVDPQLTYLKREWDDSRMWFLHGGVTQFRKGTWMVPEAFVKAFEPTDSVGLTIASPVVSPMFTKLKMEYGRHPLISFSGRRAKTATELYQKHHVYVSPHLSEGFGLMIPEAMATGMACIVSRCSAPLEFFDSSYGWWTEMSEDYVPVSGCLPDTAGFWRLPDIGSLADQMREAYENKEEAKAKGKLASGFVLDNLTWSHTVAGIKNVIKEVLDEKDFRNNASIQRGKVVAVQSLNA